MRKIIAKRKNFRENPFRASFIGSNPHSNGVFFSNSVLFFLKVNVDIMGRIVIIIIEIEIYIINMGYLINWKLIVLLYYRLCINYRAHQ